MTIKPNTTPTPKYPKLAAAAVAAGVAVALPSCLIQQQQQQQLGGAPIPPEPEIIHVSEQGVPLQTEAQR